MHQNLRGRNAYCENAEVVSRTGTLEHPHEPSTGSVLSRATSVARIRLLKSTDCCIDATSDCPSSTATRDVAVSLLTCVVVLVDVFDEAEPRRPLRSLYSLLALLAY